MIPDGLRLKLHLYLLHFPVSSRRFQIIFEIGLSLMERKTSTTRCFFNEAMNWNKGRHEVQIIAKNSDFFVISVIINFPSCTQTESITSFIKYKCAWNESVGDRKIRLRARLKNEMERNPRIKSLFHLNFLRILTSQRRKRSHFDSWLFLKKRKS